MNTWKVRKKSHQPFLIDFMRFGGKKLEFLALLSNLDQRLSVRSACPGAHLGWVGLASLSAVPKVFFERVGLINGLVRAQRRRAKMGSRAILGQCVAPPSRCATPENFQQFCTETLKNIFQRFPSSLQ